MSRIWIGRVISGLAIAFLLFDGVTKLLRVAPVVEAMTRLGYPESSIGVIGILVLACTALYLMPRTAPLGAVLLTGFLGGATATHLRVGDPVLSHLLFPVYLGAFLWLGLLLRDPRLKVLIGLDPRT